MLLGAQAVPPPLVLFIRTVIRLDSQQKRSSKNKTRKEWGDRVAVENRQSSDGENGNSSPSCGYQADFVQV